MNTFVRITTNPAQMNGESCIRNLRIPVATIVTLLAQGHPAAQILQFYSDLEQADMEGSINFTMTTKK